LQRQTLTIRLSMIKNTLLRCILLISWCDWMSRTFKSRSFSRNLKSEDTNCIEFWSIWADKSIIWNCLQRHAYIQYSMLADWNLSAQERKNWMSCSWKILSWRKRYMIIERSRTYWIVAYRIISCNICLAERTLKLQKIFKNHQTILTTARLYWDSFIADISSSLKVNC